MDVNFSLSPWTPELYLRVGDVQVYASLWKALLLVAVIVLVALFVKAITHPQRRAGPFGFALLIVTAVYLMAVVRPSGQVGLAVPWNNPPSHIEYGGTNYGTGQGFDEAPADTYGCNSEEAIREGTFGPNPQDITGVERVGHLGGVFGGPAVYVAHEERGSWLVVRATADCWIPYPEWV